MNVVPVRGEQDCGVVDAIDYPIDSISRDHDDFGMFRASHNGLHTGIDMAFDRYGDPVRAAARGRVTFSDPEGWDVEKGVVIIEHTFPDHSTFFTLYGHMEELNGRYFPHVGDCVRLGDIIGSVGHPKDAAPHLHYEVRKMRASTGGPGYWSTDPLDAGWMHPIDFTEAWQLRLNPAYRSSFTAAGAPIGLPVFLNDGSAIFAELYHLEQRNKDDAQLWQLDVQGLTGIIGLPDGRVLGRTVDDQMILVSNGKFVGSWKADHPLNSPPLRFGAGVAFLTKDSRVVLYDFNGKLLWQTDPISDHINRYMISGNLFALVSEDDTSFKLWVIDPNGKTIYQGTAPVPITLTPVQGGTGLFVLVGTQITLLNSEAVVKPLIDVGQALSNNSQITFDAQGNFVIYPGHGQRIFAYTSKGVLRWQATLPIPPLQPPLLGTGAGCLIYALTADGSLLVYRAADGNLAGITALYAGGTHGHPDSRFLKVSADDHVQFSAGYLTLTTIDGLALAGQTSCGK